MAHHVGAEFSPPELLAINHEAYKTVRGQHRLVASDTTQECQKYLSLGSNSDTHFLHGLTSCIILSYKGRLSERKTQTIRTIKKKKEVCACARTQRTGSARARSFNSTAVN